MALLCTRTSAADFCTHVRAWHRRSLILLHHVVWLLPVQAQSVVYSQRTLDGEAVALIDPNKLSDDGTVSL